jgi:hypothetical protein
MLRELIKEYLSLLAETKVILNPRSPEFKTIETFATYLMDDEREEFTHDELIALNASLRKPVAEIRAELESYGFKLAHREPEKKVRGFKSSSHDRWFGPGSTPTHGGAGIDTSTGRATVKNKTV